MAIGLSFVSGIIFPFMCNGYRADTNQVVLSGNSWVANASSVVQDTKANKPTAQSSKPSGILRNAMIVGKYDSTNGKYDSTNKTKNAKSRDWGIVPANLYEVKPGARQKALKNASPREHLTLRIDKLGLGLFLKRGDVFFVFKRDRLLYRATAWATKATSHRDLPADLQFGHAGVITHFDKSCSENRVWEQFTKCIYVTEMGFQGLEFRPLHEALSGISQVLILRPSYGAKKANKLAKAAETWLDIGATYDTWGAAMAAMKSVGVSKDPSATQPQKIFCSQLVMKLLIEADVLQGNVETCLAPSELANMLLNDITPEQRILWKSENLLGGAPAEVVFYQQCAEEAEGDQVLAESTYTRDWNPDSKLDRPWTGNGWVDSPLAVPGAMGLLTRWARSQLSVHDARLLLFGGSSQAESGETTLRKTSLKRESSLKRSTRKTSLKKKESEDGIDFDSESEVLSEAF